MSKFDEFSTAELLLELEKVVKRIVSEEPERQKMLDLLEEFRIQDEIPIRLIDMYILDYCRAYGIKRSYTDDEMELLRFVFDWYQ